MDLKTAEKLARLRKEHGYSQEDLAEKLGVSRQAVSKWERGESSPDTGNLIALAVLYGISLDEMLSFDGSNRKSRAEKREDDAFRRERETENRTEEESRKKDFFSVRTDSGEEVHIGRDGLHVNDGKGTKVEIAPFRINVTNAKSEEDVCGSECGGRYRNDEDSTRHYDRSSDKNDARFASERADDTEYENRGGTTINVNGIPIFTNGKHRHDSPTKRAVVGVLHGIVFFATLATFLLWGFLGDWGHSWLIWFALPTLTSLIEAVAYRDAKKFAFPFLVVGVYLTIGMYLDLWHPGWVLFISIPIYYFAVHIYRMVTCVKD